MAKPPERWDLQIEEPEVELPEGEFDIAEEAQELGEFLEVGLINLINIDSVTPSATLGVMYKVTVGRTENTDITKETDITEDGFTFDNRTLNYLEIALQKAQGENAEEQQEINMARKNLYVIREYVLDPFNWPAPFNTRQDI